MATKKTTTKRCIGSSRFGIEAHEARVTEFGAHSASPDGLSRMCRTCWKAYRAGLAGAKGEPATKQVTATTKHTSRRGRGSKPSGAVRTASRAAASRRAAAERLIAEVDALPAGEHVRRVGDADVQAALEAAAQPGDAAA